MDHLLVHHASFEAMRILDPADVEKVYIHIASRHHSLQWHVQSSGWGYVSVSKDEYWIEGRVVPRLQVGVIEADQILCWTDSIDGYDSCFWTYPRFFLDIVIV